MSPWSDRFRLGDRVVQIDHQSVMGTVRSCSDDGVVVDWDDGQVGRLIWSHDVCYNAFRLDVVVTERTK